MPRRGDKRGVTYESLGKQRLADADFRKSKQLERK